LIIQEAVTLSYNYVRFEALTAVKMSMLVFWVVTPCGLVGRYSTNVSEEYTASIFRVEDGGIMFLRNVGTTYKFTRRYNPENQHRYPTTS
jgi:hypothetical protein